MAISDRITSIEEHIKESYQELEGIGIDTIGVDKNLENIPKLIDGYWETLPKVTGEGTSITLDNTKEGKMKIVLKGNTLQNGTPTPDNPVPIQVVSGDNSIEVKGKNLIPITYAKIKSSNTRGSWNNNVYSYNGLTFTVNEDLSVVINGTASGNTAFNLIGTTNLFVDINISNGNYVLSGSIGGEQNMSTWGIYMAIKHSDNTTETQFCYNGDLTFTKVEGDTFFPVIRIGSGTVCNNIEIKPMIRKSGTNSTYQPYKGASYPITLPEGMFLGWIPNTDYRDIIFQAKTGDTYYDSLDSTTKESLTYGKWYLNKQIGKVVLNGSENWTDWNLTGEHPENITGYLLDNYVSYNNSSGGDIRGVCNNFKVYSNGWVYAQSLGLRQVGDTLRRFYVAIDKNITPTLEDYKTWLGTNNTTLYYVLATPTYTKIEGTLESQLNALAKSYDSQTNISQESNDLASLLNATALEEM